MSWLSADEQRAWLGLLTTMAWLNSELDRQLQRDAGISHATYGILAGLSAAENGERHMSDLAGLAGFSQSRLSHAAKRLEADGLITRRECRHDRRATHAALTDQGRALLERAAPGHVAAVRELVFDRLTADQVRALTEIVATLRAEPDPAE